MNFRPVPADQSAAIIASVQAAADYQDRIAERPPAPPHKPYGHAPHNFGVSALERGQWDRLRASGFSEAAAANIIRDARS